MLPSKVATTIAIVSNKVKYCMCFQVLIFQNVHPYYRCQHQTCKTPTSVCQDEIKKIPH